MALSSLLQSRAVPRASPPLLGKETNRTFDMEKGQLKSSSTSFFFCGNLVKKTKTSITYQMLVGGGGFLCLVLGITAVDQTSPQSIKGMHY
jgi:hypothetical protein